MEIAITRKSVTTTDEAEKQAAEDGSITGTMSRKSTVPYALYRGSGFINPLLARDTGFTYGDLRCSSML
jgi:CRISPR-associated protein Csd2